VALDAFEYYWQEYDQWYEKHIPVYLSELEALKRALLPQGNGIEIGVGTGRFASALGVKVGADLSLPMLNQAKQRGIQALCADAHHLPFKDETFDFALIVLTLCFLHDPQQAIAETRRVLRSNGTIILGMIDKDSFLGRLYQLRKSKFYEAARFFSVRQMTRLLKTQAFHTFSYHQTIFKHPNEVKAIEPTKPGHGEGGFVVISAAKG
jgi:ubiquinone/menaquinone biosynthesis C-methylase UbiE